jgi:hypothetical protein
MTKRKMPLTGGCQCGAVRYAISSDPVELYICHCRECRKQSASAFGISAFVEKPAFRLVRGKVGSWTRDTDTGHRLRCNFCPVCGSRLWHEREDSKEAARMISVKGGSLDEPLDVKGAVHIWTSRKLPGVLIPDGAVQFPGEPD